MNKKLLEESIKTVEEGLKTSKDSLEKVTHNIEEGELILKTLKSQK